MIIYAKLQSSRVSHQYGIFGGKSQTSFTRNATRAGSEEGRLFSHAKGDRALVTNAQTITLLKRERDYPAALREGQTPNTVARVKDTDKVCAKKIPKFHVKFYGQAI